MYNEYPLSWTGRVRVCGVFTVGFCQLLRMRCAWAALCGIVLITEVILINSQASDDSAIADCSQFDSCDSCISGDPALNLTRCVWQSCNNGNDTRCMSDTGYFGDCAVFNETGMCQNSDDGSKNNTTAGSTPEFSQASFDLSSFIGGIILVLVLQAGAFFAMRFLKTKDSTYETIDQTQ
ncbi:CD164 sialomucin-like 2 protein isoform X2 [Triplophysa rosa]|uniref:CD164 sialomucin-like 2 protein isoform X2 n=1 Tax=Triplophysa rosa TaxID=992332 RepID=UPI002545D48F|nr:CD164 sialomucin-like 2 protein isoform X2 [Triplophysa rosa]